MSAHSLSLRSVSSRGSIRRAASTTSASIRTYAIMAIRNWKVTGSIGGAQVLTSSRHFLGSFFRRNHARIHRDSFPDRTGYAAPMSDISFESLNGIVALMVLLALAASSAVAGIVFFVVSRAPARERWRSRAAICVAYALGCVAASILVSQLSVSARAQVDESWAWWAPALLLGGFLLLHRFGRPVR